MANFDTFIVCMFIAAILVGISQKIHIPYPIALIMGGTAMGFLPKDHPNFFDPNLILVVVLPPILYYAAFGISFREFKNNWKGILSLALGLVAFTTLVIGLIFKWLFPDLPWALAFAFGAIVSPPDAVAATTILKRFSINNKLLALLEGESLINDASAIVLYRLAVAALLSGAFSFAEATADFGMTVVGGIAVGLIFGYILQNFSRYYLDPVVGVIFSFSIPYVTYIAADYIGGSGVLAVVTNGLMGSQMLLRHHSSQRRIVGFAAWDIFTILLNCFVFILIGLQLRSLTSTMTIQQMLLYTAYAILIFICMIAIRMLWAYAKSGISYLKALKSRKADTVCPQILREAAIVGWAGMRGIVSLAAALALPLTFPNGMPLEGRSEVIFITFVVILLSLLIPGLTLPAFIKWLEIPPQPKNANILKVRKQLWKVADETIDHLHTSGKINNSEFSFLSAYFNMQHRALEVGSSSHKKMQNLELARSSIIQGQRKKLFEIWENFEIDDALLNQLEHELDLEQTRLARAELK